MNEPRQMAHIEEARREFTEPELLDKGRLIARAQQDITRLEGEKKLAADAFKGQIETKEQEIDDLCRDIRQGYELNPTPCDVVLNRPTPGMKSFVSQKSLEVIRTAPMTDAERQRSFFEDVET